MSRGTTCASGAAFPTLVSILLGLGVVTALCRGDGAQQPVIQPRKVLDRLDYNYNNITVAFSRTSRILASGGRPGTLKLWDATSGKVLTDFADHDQSEVSWVSSVAFSPDEKSLAVGTFDGHVQIWDVPGDPTKRRPRRTLSGHKDRVMSVVFSPDGKMVASASLDGRVILWDYDKGKARTTLKGHNNGVHGLLFVPDGTAVVSGDGGGRVRVWNATTGELRLTLRGPRFLVLSLATTPDQRFLAAASMSEAKVWKFGEEQELYRLEDCSHVAFTADARQVITGGGDRIGVHDAATGKKRAEYRTRFTFPHATAISPDGKTLAAGLDEGRVVLWDVDTLLKPAK